MPGSRVAVLPAQLRDWHRANDYDQVIAACEQGQLDSVEAQLLLGLSLTMSGDRERGLPLLREAVSAGLSGHEARSDLALAHILLGNIDQADRELVSLTAGEEAGAVDFSRLAAARLAQQRDEDAAELYREAVDREPGREHWHYNLGSALLRLRQLDEALESYDTALRIRPGFEQAVTARRELLAALERSAELVEELETALASAPDDYRLRIQLSRVLVHDGRFTDGIRTLAAGLVAWSELLLQREQDPESFQQRLPAQTDLRLALAQCWAQRGRHGRSLDVLRRANALQETPNVDIRCQIVQALLELQRLQEATELVAQLHEDFPEHPRVHTLDAQLAGERGDHAAAEAGLREMLARYPGNASLLCSLGQSLMWTGNLDEAADCFDRASQLNPMALSQLVRTRRLPDDEATIQRMTEVADNSLLPREARSAMSFALAEAHHSRGDYPQAATTLKAANALAARDLNYSPDHFQRWVGRNITAYSRDWFDSLPAIRPAGRQAVFVVGMPRSGTTLVEQILAAHPDVFGAGELDLVPSLTRLMPRVLGLATHYPECLPALTPELREEAARYYLHGLDQHDRDHPSIVDKLPHNFVNLGLIASILPGARIIHVRRDPRDVALSNFQQNFKARHGGMGFAFDLEHIAGQLNMHQRIMTHWREVLPIPMLELRYEALVADQAAATAQMLDYLGLDWRDEVLHFERVDRPVKTASVSQVREPIYSSSSGKWRRYETLLEPLLAALEPATLVDWG